MQNSAFKPSLSRITIVAGGVMVLASAAMLARWAWAQPAAPALAPANGTQSANAPQLNSGTTGPVVTAPANGSRPSPGAAKAREAFATNPPAALAVDRGDAQPIPAPANATAAQTERGQIDYYPINDATRSVLMGWQQLAAQRNDIRVVIDEQKSQAMVYATPAVQAQIRQQLNGTDRPQPQSPAVGRYADASTQASATPAANTAPAATTTPIVANAPQAVATETANFASAPQRTSTASLTLRNMPGQQLRPRLERIYSRALNTGNDSSGQWQTITVDADPTNRVTLAVNTQTSEVRIAGGEVHVANWQSIIEALDNPRSPEGGVTEVVAAQPAYEPFVRRAIGAMQMGGVAAQGTAAVASMLFQPAAGQPQPFGGQPGGLGQPILPPPGGVQGLPPGAESQAVPGPQTPGARSTLESLGAEGLLGPVDIRFIEGANIVIIRGREQDVQQVMEIIRRIEEITRTSAPEVRIHTLQHMDSVPMAALLTRIYSQVFQTRLGELNISALARPNAVMLIGPSTTVDLVVNSLITPLDQPVSADMRFEVFPLKQIPAATAKITVDAFLNQQATLPVDPTDLASATAVGLMPRALTVVATSTNSLIVVAGPADLGQIRELIRRIDTQSEVSAQIKVFEVQNGDAVSLVTTLQQMFNITQTTDGTPSGFGMSGVVPILFSVDARTNSIIAVGTFEQLEVVNNILTVLDAADIRERTTIVHRLSNAFANNVANAVQLWITQQRQIEAASGIITPFSLYQREVVIISEPSTNNLIISAAPEVAERIIRDVITPIDKRPPMVMIQVLIAELRLSDTDEFGVEFGIQDSLLFDRSLDGVPGFNFLNPGIGLGNAVTPETLVTAGNVGTQGLSNFGVGRANSELGFGGFVFSAQSESVNVLIRALQEKRRLEILSRPQIMALDAQFAHIEVGQRVPIIQSTTANATVTGGQTNAYTYEPVGLILDVQPLISPDNRVVMNIQAIKSEVGPEAEGIPIEISANGTVLRIPRIDNTTATTVVSAMDGQTVVLGGLITTRKADVHRRVPLIGDIPLIGDLFRFDSVNEVRNELLIILTPRVIRETDDAERLKQVESSRMSWILKDVVALNGPSGLLDRCDDWTENQVGAIYPNYLQQEGQYCPPGTPGGIQMQGPMMQSPVMQPMPGTGAGPINAPPPPTQPGQGDLTKSKSAVQPPTITQAQWQTTVKTPAATGAAPAGAAATRLPTVK